MKVIVTDKKAIYVDGTRITDRGTKWGNHRFVDEFESDDVVNDCLARGYRDAVERIDRESLAKLDAKVKPQMKTTIRTEADRAAVLAAVSALDLGKVWTVEVKRHVKRRSLNANALLWRWYTIIADSTGNDKDDIHEVFKAKYLEPVEKTVMGETVLVLSTARLNTREMSEYMEKVYAFATSQLGINLPVPEWEQMLPAPEEGANGHG